MKFSLVTILISLLIFNCEDKPGAVELKRLEKASQYFKSVGINHSPDELYHLKSFSIGDSNLHSEGFQYIQELKKLEWLTLHFNNEVNAEKIYLLKSLKNLYRVHIHLVSTYDKKNFVHTIKESLRQIGQFVNLEYFLLSIYIDNRSNLSDSKIENENLLSNLSKLNKLKELDLSAFDLNFIDGRGLKDIAQLEKLESLTILSKNLKGKYLHHLLSMKKISYFKSYPVKIPLDHLKKFIDSNKLRSITLFKPLYTNEEVEKINAWNTDQSNEKMISFTLNEFAFTRIYFH